MKKFFLAVAALAMLATSCTKDETTVAGGESLVSFSVSSPELATRADKEDGKGLNTNRLKYAFYDENGQILTALTDEVADFVGSTTINIPLVEGRIYSAIFWADNTDAPYEVNLASKTMVITATEFDGNADKYDAFYKYEVNIDPKKKVHKIELTRPFAQINIATADKTKAANAGFTAEATKVTVRAHSTLNLATGAVATDDYETFTYNWATLPKNPATATVGSQSYDMLAMNYVLVNDRELVNVKMEVSEDAINFTAPVTREYTTVPVQRNYKTFIVGNLLTTNNEFIVETNPEWEKPNNELSVWDGSVDTTWYNDTDTEFTLTDSQDLAGLAKLVDEGNTFEGKTVKLDIDMNLYKIDENGEPICFDPIGSYRFDKIFKGTFDGQGHTISNLNQNTWALDNGYYYNDCGLGLFGAVQDATIKNLKMDNASISGENGLCGVVAAVAENVTFENITVTNSKCNDYQYYAGGIVGWASGNHTYKNCNIDASTIVGGQWGDFGNSNGGVIGGVSGSAQILMEDCNVACVIDAVNDVVSAYQYYAYRCCGMLIGNTNQSQVIDGTPYAAAPQLTCKNVTVTYGDWMNYTYCEFAGTGYPYVRVQAGVSVDAYTNIRYGHPTDANGNTVVDDNHVHNDGEDHHLCLPFDQLLGGGPNGNGRNPVYGLASFPGVTVNYPYTYNQKEVSTASDFQAAIANKQNVKLATDVDMGTTQLALDNVKIDLNGKTLTTANNWGGMTLKNGASIKNGTINHTGNTAAIKAWQVGAIEDVTINVTPTDGKTKGGIVLQSGADSQIGLLKNVTITGATNGIETYNCGWTDETPAIVAMENVNIDATDTGILLSAHIGKAKNCQIKGANYGINIHLKGEFKVGIELEGCTVTGTTASIWGHDEKGISNTNNCSCFLTYDAATRLNGPFVWDFEDECKSVVTLNKPQ